MSPGVSPSPGGGRADQELECKAKAEAAELGIPLHRTPSYQKLQQKWYGRLARTGFKDIEVQDPKLGEPGPYLLGIHTAKILERGGKAPGPNDPDGVIEKRQIIRAQAAIQAVESQEAWFEMLREEVATVRKRWPRAKWRARAMELYAEGMTYGEVSAALNRNPNGSHSGHFSRAQVKSHICNEVRRIVAERGARWEAAKAAIRESRMANEEGEEGQDRE